MNTVATVASIFAVAHVSEAVSLRGGYIHPDVMGPLPKATIDPVLLQKLQASARTGKVSNEVSQEFVRETMAPPTKLVFNPLVVEQEDPEPLEHITYSPNEYEGNDLVFEEEDPESVHWFSFNKPEERRKLEDLVADVEMKGKNALLAMMKDIGHRSLVSSPDAVSEAYAGTERELLRVYHKEFNQPDDPEEEAKEEELKKMYVPETDDGEWHIKKKDVKRLNNDAKEGIVDYIYKSVKEEINTRMARKQKRIAEKGHKPYDD